jgi:hypothetical protein
VSQTLWKSKIWTAATVLYKNIFYLSVWYKFVNLMNNKSKNKLAFFLLVSCLVHSWAMRLETVHSFEMFVNSQQNYMMLRKITFFYISLDQNVVSSVSNKKQNILKVLGLRNSKFDKLTWQHYQFSYNSNFVYSYIIIVLENDGIVHIFQN